jgi:hypothetical protein
VFVILISIVPTTTGDTPDGALGRVTEKATVLVMDISKIAMMRICNATINAVFKVLAVKRDGSASNVQIRVGSTIHANQAG